MTLWQRIARDSTGPDYAVAYAERFRRLAASGEDVHGEAAFVADLVAPPARVLDAGCGTGRIAIRLHELGYEVVGVDLDPTMLREARTEAPGLDWRVGDLASLDTGEQYDVVLVAGNTLPLLEPGTLTAAVARLAAHLQPEGRLVCGFGLDPAHLPAAAPCWPSTRWNRRSSTPASSRWTVGRAGTGRSTPRQTATSSPWTEHTDVC